MTNILKSNVIKILIITGVVLASSAFVSSRAFAARPQGSTRPGWGFGDKNHTHTGPPGQSVRP